MLRIAISGHRGLPRPTADLVDEAIRTALAEHAPDVTGLSCLADGADQIFARAVTGLGGKLEAIIPAAEYRAGLPAEAHPEYDRLLAQATAVRRLPFTESTPESHMAASQLMIDGADHLNAGGAGTPDRWPNDFVLIAPKSHSVRIMRSRADWKLIYRDDSTLLYAPARSPAAQIAGLPIKGANPPTRFP